MRRHRSRHLYMVSRKALVFVYLPLQEPGADLLRAMFSCRCRSISTRGSSVAWRPLHARRQIVECRTPCSGSDISLKVHAQHLCSSNRDSSTCQQLPFQPSCSPRGIDARQYSHATATMHLAAHAQPSAHRAWWDALFAAATFASTLDTCLNLTRFLHLSFSCTPVRSLQNPMQAHISSSWAMHARCSSHQSIVKATSTFRIP
jgi:hypothetical protein